MNLPQPVHVQRRRRWSDSEGDLEVDRLLGGSDNYHREMFREHRPKTTTVGLMIDTCANYGTSHQDLFYRTAAAVVACDMLEESGYSCEVWAYNITTRTYLDGKGAFVAFRLKEAGDPLDVDTMAKGTSPYFFRTAMVACQFVGANNVDHPTCGSASQVNKERWFGRHCDIDNNMDRLWVPQVSGLTAAVEGVRRMIEEFRLQEA